jgi:hypothetical protein
LDTTRTYDSPEILRRVSGRNLTEVDRRAPLVADPVVAIRPKYAVAHWAAATFARDTNQDEAPVTE